MRKIIAMTAFLVASMPITSLAENDCLSDKCHSIIEKKSSHSAYRDAHCIQCHKATEVGHNQGTISSTSCMKCHDTRDKEERGVSSSHSPFEEGNCTKCHTHHSSEYLKLLVKPMRLIYVTDAVGELIFERIDLLCWDCHDRQLAELEITDNATRFRDKNTNMHYIHVTKFEKGEASKGGCLVCHEVHNARQDNLVRDSVPFDYGDWKLDIRYEKNETGGKCTIGCHKESSYNR